MINSQSIVEGINLAKHVEARKLEAEASPSSILSHLVAKIGYLPEDKPLLETLTEDTKSPEFNELLDKVVDKASGNVDRLINLVKEELVLRANNIVMKVYGELEGREEDPLARYEIESIYLPEVLSTTVADQLVERFSKGTAIVEPMLVIGDYTESELLELLPMTNSEEFDSLLLEELNESSMRSISSALAGHVHMTSNLSAIEALAALVICTNIDSPKEGTPVSLNDWKANLSGAKIHLAKAVVDRTNVHKTKIRTKILYELKKESNKIQVIGENYLELLDAGVTSQMIIANEELGRRYNYHNLLQKNVQEELDNYYRQVSITNKHTLDRTRTDRMGRLAIQFVMEEVREIVADLRSEDKPEEADALRERATTICDSLRPEIYRTRRDEDMESLVIGLVVSIFYPHTDAGAFLIIMDDIEHNNKAIEVEELTTLAAITFVSNWVAEQITLLSE